MHNICSNLSAVSQILASISVATLLSACALGGGEKPTMRDVLLTPVVVATTPVLAAGLATAAITSNESTVKKTTAPMDDKAKLEFAEKAAAMNGCRGKAAYLPDAPPVTNDPSERTHLVRCGKAEMKVTCRYFETRVNECYVKWTD